MCWKCKDKKLGLLHVPLSRSTHSVSLEHTIKGRLVVIYDQKEESIEYYLDLGSRGKLELDGFDPLLVYKLNGSYVIYINQIILLRGTKSKYFHFDIPSGDRVSFKLGLLRQLIFRVNRDIEYLKSSSLEKSF